MTVPPVEYCCLAYAEAWFSIERHLARDLKTGSGAEKLEALKKAGTYFKVDRNLQKRHDVDLGIPRYGPVLDVLMNPENQPTTLSNPDDLVESVRQQIGQVTCPPFLVQAL